LAGKQQHQPARHRIEASNGLKAWTHMTTLTNETGTLSFTDPLANSASERFYRVATP
jgi:hypothetical protein